MKKSKNKGLIKFIIFSLIGVLLLMTPFKDESGNITVAVSKISTYILDSINSIISIHYIILALISLSTLLSIIYKIYKPKFILNSKILRDMSDTSLIWIIVRIIGLVFAVLVSFNVGPEFIKSSDTGGLILFDLIGGLFSIFLVAGFILPLLTEFGLLEFSGVYVSKIMRPIFNLPGRSAIDCLASWVGDGTIGVTLTNKQYLEGFYTEREASVIATTFSAVSITFCLVVLENIKMLNSFVPFYITVSIAGIIAALIAPKLPPLSKKRDIRLKDNKDINSEIVPKNSSRFKWAIKIASDKAEKSSNIKEYLYKSLDTVFGLWFNVVPVIMAVGTIALIISTYTSIFKYLGIPFIPLLKLFNIPEANVASEAMVVGFADMVVPSIIVSNIESEFTRFVIGAVSVTQLIYISETGSVILGSDLPINIWELFIIFIERTLVTLPIIVLFAYIFF